MDINALLQAIQSSPLAVYIGESSWGFQAVETVHVLATSLVVGTLIIVDVRLLGLASRTASVTEIAADCLKWTWGGFIVALLSGSLMFATKATIYFYNDPFRIKMFVMVLAWLNMMVFHFGIYRDVKSWNVQLPTPVASKIAGTLSLIFWITVVICGRWTGFSTSVDLPPPPLL